MADEVEKVKRVLRIPISEANYQFIRLLSDKTVRYFERSVREEAVFLLDKLRKGKPI